MLTRTVTRQTAPAPLPDVLDGVRAIAVKDLGPIVQQIDADGLYPEAVLRAFGFKSDTGFYRVGNTDNAGTADHNLKLSQERAEAVAAWLTAHGVPATRLTTKASISCT